MIPKRVLIFFIVMGFFPYVISQDFESGFRERSRRLIEYASDFYQLPEPANSDPDKVYWPVVIARLQKYGIHDSIANYWIGYEAFREKLPFHFALVGMARIMAGNPLSPAVTAYKHEYLKRLMDRTDSYNAWTCEGTENHLNMSRTSAYLFAEIMDREEDRYPDAKVYRREMKKWILEFTRMAYRNGTSEFNASTCGAYNIIGYLNLYDFAEDKDVRAVARAMLDYYAAELALSWFQGMTSGAEGRGSPSEKSLIHESEWIAWLWFGGITEARAKKLFENNSGKEPLQAVHAATSAYRPPEAIQRLSFIKNSQPSWYENSKPLYYSQEQRMRDFLFLCSSYSLGSIMDPYGAYASSAFKNTSWKLVSEVAPGIVHPQMVTGGGCYYEDRNGMVRNPYTQLAQYKNVLVMLNLLPDNYTAIDHTMETFFHSWAKKWELDFVQRFSALDPKITEVGNPVKMLKRDTGNIYPNACYIRYPTTVTDTMISGVLFIRLDRSYLAIRSVNLNSPVREKMGIVRDYNVPGALCGLVLEAGEARDFLNFEEFILKMLSSTSVNKTPDEKGVVYISLSGDELAVNFNSDGTFTEPVYDWGFGPVKPSSYTQSPPYRQPEWPEGEGFGRVPSCSLNGLPVYTERNQYIWSGPNIKLGKSILSVDAGKDYKYTVNYEGQWPTFSERDNRK